MGTANDERISELGLTAELADRMVGEPRLRAGGECVLLWIRAAMRADSNPALEAAICMARALDVPLLAYQALDDRHPYASDRIWRFVLEGARDLAADLEARGVRYVFHLVRPDGRGAALRDLADRSAVVVADVHPVEPIRTWTRRLAESTETPVLEIDASCVVPVTATKAAFDRAFSFRKATKRERKRWLGWQPEEQPAPRAFEGELPFTPLPIQSATDRQIDEWIADCAIDHGVAPVAHTRGGTRAANERWQRFFDSGLARYADTRNHPLERGVSRLSAYFHFGMLSPLRVAAECQRFGGRGADKYLDELLVWREVAWHFCHHSPEVDSMAAIPEWARETLQNHAADTRDATYSWAQLAEAATGDALWDACQRSLLHHGELHNNVRMTWGKAVLSWTASPEDALAILLDLNHRYALDGRDPASYGGILWCLGQFDRPFPPARPVTGTVRERTTRVHSSRLDVARYAERMARPSTGDPLTVAIVGRGVAAFSAAQVLLRAGHLAWCVGADAEVCPLVPGETADRALRRELAAWQSEGVAGEPGALLERLARGVPVEPSRAAEATRQLSGQWRVDLGGDRHLAADVVLDTSSEVSGALTFDEEQQRGSVGGASVSFEDAWRSGRALAGMVTRWAARVDIEARA